MQTDAEDDGVGTVSAGVADNGVQQSVESHLLIGQGRTITAVCGAMAWTAVTTSVPEASGSALRCHPAASRKVQFRTGGRSLVRKWSAPGQAVAGAHGCRACRR